MESDPVYKVDDEHLWRETLADGTVKFFNTKPSLKEQDADVLNKKEKGLDKYELSEANCIKNLKTDTSTLTSMKMFYYPAKESVFNILEVKKDDNGTPNFVKMVPPDSSDEITLEDPDEISTLRDYIYLSIKVLSNTDAPQILNSIAKLGGKLENEVGDSLKGSTGRTISMFKFFTEKKMFDKSSMISSIPNVSDNTCLVATSGFSKPFIFKRFQKMYEWPYWGCSGYSPEAIAFIPNQEIILQGFTLYVSDNSAGFECYYKIYIDDDVVEESGVFKITEYEDKYFYKVKLKELHEVKAGSRIDVAATIAIDIGQHSYGSFYYGQDGEQFATVENDNPGLFEVKASTYSGSTYLNAGNIPEISYFM